MRTACRAALAAAIGLFLAFGSASAQINPAKDDLPDPKRIYSPYVERTEADRNFAEGLFWGDTHLHTGYSTDAGMIGCKLGPEDAYRFARGEVPAGSPG